MEKMLITRDKSRNLRSPRSAALAARAFNGSCIRKFMRVAARRDAVEALRQGSNISCIRKFMRVYPDRSAESKRRSNGCSRPTLLCPQLDRSAESKRRSNGSSVLRKFVLLPSVRGENRLPKEAGRGTPPTVPYSPSRVFPILAPTEAGSGTPQTTTARSAVSITTCSIFGLSVRQAQTVRPRSAVSITGTQYAPFPLRPRGPLRLGRPYPSLARLQRKPEGASRRRASKGQRAAPHTRLQQKPEGASRMRLPTIVPQPTSCIKARGVPITPILPPGAHWLGPTSCIKARGVLILHSEIFCLVHHFRLLK